MTPTTQALHKAVAALYFDDSSDFKHTLYGIVELLNPEVSKLLERSPKEAYDQTLARAEQAEQASERLTNPSAATPPAAPQAHDERTELAMQRLGDLLVKALGAKHEALDDWAHVMFALRAAREQRP